LFSNCSLSIPFHLMIFLYSSAMQRKEGLFLPRSKKTRTVNKEQPGRAWAGRCPVLLRGLTSRNFK
jgi:hypothetical protein